MSDSRALAHLSLGGGGDGDAAVLRGLLVELALLQVPDLVELVPGVHAARLERQHVARVSHLPHLDGHSVLSRKVTTHGDLSNW